MHRCIGLSDLRQELVRDLYGLHIGAASQCQGRDIPYGCAHQGGHAILALGVGRQDGGFHDTGGGIGGGGYRYAVLAPLLQKADCVEGATAVDALPFLSAPGLSPLMTVAL